jgi:FixJ family two-component response regulator
MSKQQWVAIIDDDDSFRTSLVRIVELSGIHARGFSSAEEYLSRPADTEPTCIVLDIHLGAGLNGFALQERLESEGRARPIIFMSGEAAPLPGLAADFLRKPFAADELIVRVRRHLLGELGATPPQSDIAEGS